MKKIVIILVALLGFAACKEEEFLDLENPNNVTTDEALQNMTSLDAKLLVSSAYGDLQANGLYGRFGYFLFDHMSDELIVSTNSNNAALNQIQTLTINPLSESNRLYYGQLYRAIFKANTAINLLTATTSPNISEEDKLVRIAEARFLRGFFYFKLVTRYGGVPLEDGLEVLKSRSSERQVYDFVINDFKFASENLADKNATEVGRPTKGSALAMLGKALLFSIDPENSGTAAEQGKYTEAYDALSKVEAQGYVLMDEYLDNFTDVNEFNDESLFEVGFIDATGSDDVWSANAAGNNETSFISADYSGWGNSAPTKKMIEAYEGDGVTVTGTVNNIDRASISVTDRERSDPRLFFTWWTPGEKFGSSEDFFWGDVPDKEAYERVSNGYNAPTGGNLACRKFSRLNTNNFQETAESGVNYRILRFAEVLLLQAEAALFKENPNPAEAIELMNRVRARPSVNMPPYGSAEVPEWPVSTTAQIFAALKHERQVELAMEGKRLVDLFRWGDDIKELSDVKTTYTRATGRYLPIPKEQIDTNPLIDPTNPAPDL